MQSHTHTNIHTQTHTHTHTHRVDLHIPSMDTVGGYSITSTPDRLRKERTLSLAIQHSDHPPALWMSTEVLCTSLESRTTCSEPLPSYIPPSSLASLPPSLPPSSYSLPPLPPSISHSAKLETNYPFELEETFAIVLHLMELPETSFW